MNLFKLLRKNLNAGQPGQSLVEMALTIPVLLLLFIGVFEVGWALRGYLVLSNVNREATRFAVKTGTLDYSVETPPITSTIGATVGYDTVLSHTMVSLGYKLGLPINDPGQRATLPLDFLGPTPNSTMIMSHFWVDSRLPCARKQGPNYVVPFEFDTACDCTSEDPNDSQWFTQDDAFRHPGTHAYYRQTYGLTQTTRIRFGQPITVTYDSRLDVEAETDALMLKNNQLNCALLKANPEADVNSNANNAIIVESFYDQPQLLGLPLISNALTDPIPFYGHTAMRIVTSRDADTTDSVGPICEAYPLTVKRSVIDATAPGTVIDVMDGNTGDDRGWLAWNPHEGDSVYIEAEILTPRLSVGDYVNPDPAAATADGPDTSLSVGDYVTSVNGNHNDIEVRDALDSVMGEEIVIPVWDDPTGFTSLPNPLPPPPNVPAYRIITFVRVQIISYDLTSTDPKVMARYIEPAEECL